MRDTTEQRIVKNNLTFREANERIRTRAEEYQAPVSRIPFLCECPRPDCVQIVRLTLVEYSAVREDPKHFFTVPGHEAAESPVGHVVGHEDGYVIVEKDHSGLNG